MATLFSVSSRMERTLESTLLEVTKARLVHDFPGQIAACLDVLSEEEAWWRPNEQANAVGNLVLHLAGSNRYHLEHVIAGRGTHRDRDAEFSRRGGMPKSELRRTFDDSTAVVKDVLDGLDPAALMTATDRSKKHTTYAQVLMHVSHHNAAHMGQIVWATKMLQPGALEDLWMKMRSG